jgi:hypothetical protein
MRRASVAAVAILGSVLVVGCQDNPVGMAGDSELTASHPDLTVSSGETYSHIEITTRSAEFVDLEVGGSMQMAATLHYSAGGTLRAVPYASWRSSDPCVASVTSAFPSWGLVRGVKEGTTRIIAEAWGRADTIVVAVTGTGDLDPSCEDREWSWDWEDVSFTGSPADGYSVAAGEKLTRVVLFAGPRPDWTIEQGSRVRLQSELWYDEGGKSNGRGFVTFSSMDHSVATVSARGVVTARGPGRTKIVARLGQFSDEVPIFVR